MDKDKSQKNSSHLPSAEEKKKAFAKILQNRRRRQKPPREVSQAQPPPSALPPEVTEEERREMGQRVRDLLDSSDPRERKIGLEGATLLPQKDRLALLQDYLDDPDVRIRKALARLLIDVAEEGQKESGSEVYHLLHQMSQSEENSEIQALLAQAGHSKPQWKAAAQSASTREESHREILGRVTLHFPSGEEKICPLYQISHLPGVLFIASAEGAREILFSGQESLHQPYVIDEEGRFSPRGEDEELFQGDLEGRVVEERE